MQCLIICGSMLIDVYNHTRFAFPTKKWLKQTSQLTLSEWNIAWLHPQGGKKLKLNCGKKIILWAIVAHLNSVSLFQERHPVGCSYLSLSDFTSKSMVFPGFHRLSNKRNYLKAAHCLHHSFLVFQSRWWNKPKAKYRSSISCLMNIPV